MFCINLNILINFKIYKWFLTKIKFYKINNKMLNFLEIVKISQLNESFLLSSFLSLDFGGVGGLSFKTSSLLSQFLVGESTG